MNAENQIQNPNRSPVERIDAQGVLMADPRAYIQHASVVLAQVREKLIKAESLHQAKRSQEIVTFKDRLQRLDADHEKAVLELTTMIERLEAFRG